MKCSQVQNKLSAYIDGEISDKEKTFIEEHIRTCKKCSKELATLAELGTELNALGSMEVPVYFRTHVIQRIKDEISIQIPIIEKIQRAVFPLAATAALVVSLLFGNYLGKSLFQGVAETSPRQESEIAGVFGLSSLTEFPEGSLSDVFYNYVPGGDK